MALSLNGLEPVEFKGRVCRPFINAELRLRLTEIKNYGDSANDILASAFPDDEEYVRNFLKNAPAIEKEILHAYLVGGDTATKAVIDSLESGIRKTMNDAMRDEK